MITLRQVLKSAERNNAAIGHFNISDLVMLKAIFEAGVTLSEEKGENIPIIIGTSEGEREFLGLENAVSLVRNLREKYNYPIFLNADHTKSVEAAKGGVDAGYDAILFDGGKLPLEENIAQTKEVVEYAKLKNPDITVEGELGYIGSSSEILKDVPEGAAIEEKDLTTKEDALRFVKESGIDMLAPAVGNLHGMFKNAPNPDLYISRIKEIKDVVNIPLVLHGGSGVTDRDFISAINSGITVVHISTELRVAWRKGIEAALKEKPSEIAPYKIYPVAISEIKKVVQEHLRLFNRM